MAMISGKIAGEAAVAAHGKGDFSAGTLRAYDENLRQTFVLKDLMKYRKASAFMEKTPQFFTQYTGMLNAVATEFFTVDSVPKRAKQWKVWKMAGNKFKLAWDMLGLAWRVK